MNTMLFAAVRFTKEGVEIEIPDIHCVCKGDSLTLAYSNTLVVSKAILKYNNDNDIIFTPTASKDDVDALLHGSKDFVTCINVA